MASQPVARSDRHVVPYLDTVPPSTARMRTETDRRLLPHVDGHPNPQHPVHEALRNLKRLVFAACTAFNDGRYAEAARLATCAKTLGLGAQKDAPQVGPRASAIKALLMVAAEQERCARQYEATESWLETAAKERILEPDDPAGREETQSAICAPRDFSRAQQACMCTNTPDGNALRYAQNNSYSALTCNECGGALAEQDALWASTVSPNMLSAAGEPLSLGPNARGRAPVRSATRSPPRMASHIRIRLSVPFLPSSFVSRNNSNTYNSLNNAIEPSATIAGEGTDSTPQTPTTRTKSPSLGQRSPVKLLRRLLSKQQVAGHHPG